jgi:hypothetical protein
MKRGIDLNGIATFNKDGRLKTYDHSAPVFILRINHKKILMPMPLCLN